MKSVVSVAEGDLSGQEKVAHLIADPKHSRDLAWHYFLELFTLIT